MNLDLAVSLENELLTNPASVDLLVSLCYSAALERGLKDASHFPDGLGLQVPERAPWAPGEPTKDFDTLTNNDEKCKAIAALIAELPKIAAMRGWILKEDVAETDKVLYHARKLSDCPGVGGRAVSPAAWKLLRWIVASCTSYLKVSFDPSEFAPSCWIAHRCSCCCSSAGDYRGRRARAGPEQELPPVQAPRRLAHQGAPAG